MTDAMDIDPPAPAGNAMAAMMAASKKGKGKMELSQAEVDAKDKKDKEGLPWYVPFFCQICLSSVMVPFRRWKEGDEETSFMILEGELMIGWRNIDLFIWMMWFRIRISPLLVEFSSSGWE